MRGINPSFCLVFTLMISFLTATGVSQVPGDVSATTTSLLHENSIDRMSGLCFIENRGQLRDTDGNPRPDIRYYADVSGTRLYVTEHGISYVFVRCSETAPLDRSRDYDLTRIAAEQQRNETTLLRVDMDFENGNQNARLAASEKLPGYRNFYYAHCPEGILHVPTWRTLVYEDVYPSIDMVIRFREGRVKSEFVVRPGGDPSRIRLRYRGAEQCGLRGDGGIVVATALGRIEESAAESWTRGGSHVQSAFRMEKDVATFTLGAYDRNRTLIIDPWATYHGGSGSEQFLAMVCDAQGGIYASGRTSSADFPVKAGVQMTNGGGQDAMIVKYNVSGQLQWATFYGGSSGDASATVTPHPSGGVVVGGNTSSTDFPVQNAFQPASGGGTDSFILRLTDSGSRIWATYFGGSGSDADGDGFAGQGLGCDQAGNIFFHSASTSTDLPVISAWQSSVHGNVDAFLIKLSASGAHLWSTYYGGSSEEHGKGVGVTPQGTVGICGRTTSTDLPLLHEHDGVYQGNSQDGYAAEFSANGQLLWSSYLGGDGFDAARSMCADNAGALYIASRCQSTDMVTVNPMQAALAGSQDIHIIKYRATPTPQNGRSIEWASYLGGAGYDDINRGTITVNDQGNILLVGSTSSADFPIKDALQPTIAGGEDLYVLVMSKYGTIHWSTFYGGSGGDDAYQGAFTPDNDIVVAGYTNSGDFPLEAPEQSTIGGGTDGFLLHLSSQGLVVTPPLPPAALSATALSPTRVSLAWTDNSNNETWFVIEYEHVSNQWQRIDSVAANLVTHIVVNLQPEMEHRFRVRAVNSKFTSDPTNVASATTPPFMAPGDLQAEAVSSDAVKLTWEDHSTNESGFIFEIKQNVGVWDEVDAAGPNETEHTVLGLQPSTEYTFRMKAVEGIIASPVSNEATATTWLFLNAPTNLTATVNSETEVLLMWEDNADGEENYELEQRHESGDWTLVTTLPANAETYTLQGLVPRTHYGFRVRAVGVKAASSWSNVAEVLTKTKPAPPLEFTCTAIDHQTVTISWLRGSENEDQYEIERKSAAEDWRIVHTAGPGDGSVTDEHLQASTTYWYRIHALNDVGASGWTEDTAVTYPMPIPDVPFGLMATAGGPFSIRVTWIMPDPSFEDAFELEYSLSGDEGDFAALLPAPQRGDRSFDHEGLQPETTYWYRIRAVNVSGASAWSNIASTTTLRREQKIPVAPFNVTAVALSDTEIRVDWSMPDPTLAAGFEFERSLTGDPGDFTRMPPDPEFDVRSRTDVGLSPKTTYWYRIRAFNEHGTSPYSAIVSATTLNEPLSPEFLAAMDAKEQYIPQLEQLRVADDHRLGALRTALGDYPRGYDESAARDLLTDWRAEQPDGAQNAISALRRYTLLERSMLEAVGSDQLEPPVPGARETARQAVLAPSLCAKDLLALGVAWHDERALLGSAECVSLDRAMQDLSWSAFDAAQTLFTLTGTGQGTLADVYAAMQRGCCSPAEVSTTTIPLVGTYYQELTLMDSYIRATQPLIPYYASQTRNIWYSGSILEAEQRYSAFIDDVRSETEDLVTEFDTYRGICYGLDVGYTISSSINSNLSLFMRKMTVLKPDMVHAMWRAVEAADVPAERTLYLVETLPRQLEDVAAAIFDPSSGFRKQTVPPNGATPAPAGVDRTVLDTDRAALEALRAEVLEKDAAYIEAEYTALGRLGRASIEMLQTAQRPLFGIPLSDILAKWEGPRGDYYRTMAYVQKAKLLRAVLSVSLSDYLLDPQDFKVDPLAAEIDTIIGALYGAADGIDAELARSASLVSLPALTLDAASLSGRVQDGPKRYRLYFTVKNVGGADASDAALRVELLCTEGAAIGPQDYDAGSITPTAAYAGTLDLDIEPGTDFLPIAVRMTAGSGGTWTDIRSLPVPDISTAAEHPPVARTAVLHQNYPNPFDPVTTISFTLPRSAAVTLVVTDALGRTVAMPVVNTVYPSGRHTLRFDATGLPPGIYSYRLESEGVMSLRRMVRVR